MIGNQIDQLTRQGSEKVAGAVLTAPARRVLLVLMVYYLRTTRRADADGGGGRDAGCGIPGASRAGSCS